MKKKIITTLIALTLLNPITAAFAADAPKVSPTPTDTSGVDIAASAAIAIDANTGKILYAKNVDEARGIASESKLITAYLVYKAVKEGKISWDDEVSINDATQKLSRNNNLSNVVLYTDVQYKVSDLLDAALIASANAAAQALAIKLAGSEEEFAKEMTTQLNEWGFQDVHFINASGLNDHDVTGASDDENTMSAKAMAATAFHLYHDFPEVLDITKQPTKVFPEGKYPNITMNTFNLMLPTQAFYMEGVDGFKTGTTDKAGACFTGTIDRAGTRLITVVLDAKNADGKSDKSARFTQTKVLMNYVLDNWKYDKLDNKGTRLDKNKTVYVANAKTRNLKIALGEETAYWYRTKATVQTPTYKVEPLAGLEAPITKGQTVANATLSVAEDKLGYLTDDLTPVYPMVAMNEDKKANIFTTFIRWIADKVAK
ncbi:MAG: serine hydrolase [Lactobacillales bacterium]|jgi:D-alanyl-D-alanine carboxypeptidase (penicillin-binding protein 5/6)|nr:serine hydrolase [Lactobacillales bacterium]